MELIKSAKFGELDCSIYSESNERYMTREQIGRALQYSDPQKAIDNLHAKHRARLDKFSVTLKVRATDGKCYTTTLYSRKGIMEICRWSQQPNADAFMDWTWEVMDNVIEKKLNQQEEPQLAIPKDYPSALRALADTFEEKLALEAQITEDAPKVSFYDNMADSDQHYPMAYLARTNRTSTYYAA